ncbi:STAS domain-containing protein [Streptomyces sp. NPDC056296]|uniref:STAS domain-containing protein n=1 Tax=Streptomyces sp. NPDC056296 TaxID=3345775 RepID=UPI0035D89722
MSDQDQEFRLGRREEAGRVVITVAGEIDLGTAPRLRDALDEALSCGVHRVEVDFSGVRFCDCSGLGVLLRARAQADNVGVVFGVAQVRAPVVGRLFRLTQTGAVLGVSGRAA